MVFSSVSFLFLFLPIVLALYHLVFFLPITLGSKNAVWWRLSNGFLLLASLVFYFWGEGNKVWIFVGATFLDFVAALVISRARSPRFRKTVLTVSICSNLAILAWFKYLNFGIDSLNSALTYFHLRTLDAGGLAGIVLPLGISFFTFHSMSYTIDVYRGEVQPTHNFIDYACYVLMFPQLVAGPIVRFSYVARALTSRVVTLPYFASGVARFSLGLGKKVLIANNVAIAADKIFALPPASLSAGVAWLGVLAYSLQIYFDFSGYSDMAIGLGRMFGFELPRNFNYPYIARSVREFWRRWHISLSTWFQDYLYIPMGGSRVSRGHTYFNLITVFFLCGLWHGAKWTFVAWGIYYGLFLVLERQPFVASTLARAGRAAHVYALLVIAFGWTLFRADTFSQAMSFYRAMAGLGAAHSPYPVRWFLGTDVVTAGLAGILFSAPVLPAVSQWLDRQFAAKPVRPAIAGLALARCAGVFAILLLCSMSLASGTYNPFIYFRF